MSVYNYIIDRGRQILLIYCGATSKRLHELMCPLTKKKALWQSQWRPCGKFAAALPQTHCKVAAVSFYHANEPSCRFAINLPQPCGKIIYVNYPLAKLWHSVTLHICFLAMLWHTNQFINIHGNLLANLRHTLP